MTIHKQMSVYNNDRRMAAKLQLNNRKRILLISLAVFLVVLATILLVIGIVQLKKSKCSGNDERMRLLKFLKKIKRLHYETFPHSVIHDPDVELDEVISNFKPYDPSPEAIKGRTDLAHQLSDELQNLNFNLDLLKPREKKAVAQLEQYLDSIFGNPYSENYYAGDWMMGPNYFCWQLICDVGVNLQQHYNEAKGVKPKTLSDVEKILANLIKTKDIFEQQKSNMAYGVKAGMVRAVDDCKSGKNAFKAKFRKIDAEGPDGVTKEDFSFYLLLPTYYDQISDEEKKQFNETNDMHIEAKIEEVLRTHVGAPIYDFIQYLEKNYSRHCVHSSVASGLANLPLKNIWFDQNKTSEMTLRRLPTGEPLDGKQSYEMILPFFTTSKKYTAQFIHDLGIERRNLLYPEAEVIALAITGKKTKLEAVSEFKFDLNLPKHFFNSTPIPDNENEEEGGKRCPTMEAAKMNCPVRYEAMQKWFKAAREMLARIDPITTHMFYFSGEKATTPGCPIKMVANFNPSSGSQSYRSAGKSCSSSCEYFLPFFLKRPGPKYNLYSVAGHEGRPGHHTQVQGFFEHFASGQQKDIIDWVNGITYYTAFTEGWALYAEYPLLAKETSLYKENQLQEYGMLKWQIWRALRLIIDTGLHFKGMTQQQALDIFEKYAWDTTDKAAKDTVRYMSAPGQATAYMIGQLAIWSMRNKTESELSKAGVQFDEKEFHYQVLSQGSSPLDYLISYIDNFIECKIDKNKLKDCPEILNPKLSNIRSDEVIGTAAGWKLFAEKMNRYQYD